MKKWYRENRTNIFMAAAVVTLLLGTIDEPIPTETTETPEDIIHWKQEEIIETELQEVHIEEPETVIVTEPAEEVTFYDVPLSEELQLHIFAECEKHNIAPAIVIAMIERESDFDASDIGDNGNSFGLMQIQPKWHQGRMDRLGCTDLLNPFENVTVGIDYLAELKSENSDLYWCLMAYNAGRSKATKWMDQGIYSNYAKCVVERASELENGGVYYGME